MTILLSQAVRVGGAVLAAGTTQTLAADLEADLVTRKIATYTVAPMKSTVPLFWENDPLTGKVEILDPTTGLPLNIGGSSGVTSTGVMTTKQYGGCTSTSLAAGVTNVEQKPVDIYPFYGVRLMLVNYGSSAVNIANCKIASAPTDLHNGVGLTYSQVTVGGSSSFTIPAMTQGPGGTASNNRIPGIVYTDFIPLISVPRSDTPGAPFLIQMRSYDAGVINVTGGSITRTNASKPYLADRGYLYGWHQPAGDLVTTPTAVTPMNSSALGIIGHIEAFTGMPHYRLFAFGDSLTGGYSGMATTDQCGWTNILDYNMRANGNIGGVSNYAVGGMLQANFITTMKNLCSVAKPSAVYLSSFSPNSGTNLQSQWDAQLAATLEAVDWLISKGIKPFVSNAMPLDGLSVAQNDRRVAFNLRLANYLSKVCDIWDFSSVIEDPANTGKMLPAYNYDGIHQNLAGQEALAAYVSAKLGL